MVHMAWMFKIKVSFGYIYSEYEGSYDTRDREKRPEL